MNIKNKKLAISLGSIQQFIVIFMIILPASSFKFFRSILLLSFAFSMSLFFNKKSKINEIVLFLLLIISLITVFFSYSLTINYSFADSHIAAFIRYITFFSFLFLLILSYEHKLLTIKKITKAIFLGLFTYNIIKVFLILLVPFGFFTARGLVEFVSGFNIIITPGFWGEDAIFSRISF